MIKNLNIKNYVLIDKLSVSFNSGLTIISGETGAGKSILLGALSLLFGERADSKAIMNPDKKCIIEGEFSIEGYDLEDFFIKNDLDFASNTLLRRELNVDGKSRSFINDTPVNLSVLKQLSQRLVDIHSQHETITLADSTFQMELLDAFADCMELLSKYRKKLSDYRSLTQRYQKVKEEHSKFEKQKDYNEYLYNELESISLEQGMNEQMEEELGVLNNAELIKSVLTEIENAVRGEGQSLLPILNIIINQLNQISKFHSAGNELADRVQSVFIELEDICDEIQRINEQTEYDQEKIELLTDSLNQINRLLNKHQVQRTEDLIQIKNDLSNQLKKDLDNADEIVKLESECKKLESDLNKMCKQLHQKRLAVIDELQSQIQHLLKDVNMPDSQFAIELHYLTSGSFNMHGQSSVRFLFSANKGDHSKPLPIAQVASGGELSRLMLCIKSVYAKVARLPLIIFDEIDSGISGESASKVAAIIDEIGQKRQVFTITHLPQMAGKGKNHILVYKYTESGQTFSNLKILNDEERVEEIARMISGDKTTEISRMNARELLNH